jgi:Ran GTPase-activating protein (RanGAP) involved in mRNA processing and transport
MRPSVRELIGILDFCKLNPQITTLKIAPPIASPLSLKAQEKLIEFFSNYQSIRELHLELTSTGTAPIQPKQLAALIQSGGLKALSIQGVDLMSPSPEDSKAFFDGIKRNSSLEILDLSMIRNSQLVAGIIEAMAEGKMLKRLDLTIMEPKGIGNSIARLLTSNTNLRALKIDFFSGQCLDEVESVFKSIAHNHTLEILDFSGSGFQFDLTGKNLLKLLALNQGLKEIRLSPSYDMTDEAVAALTELINTHPTLTSIHIGSVPTNHQDRMSIAHALKSNPRITKIAANLLAFYNFDIRGSEHPIHITEFLNTIGDCPSLTALSLESVPDLDCLIQFLETHPQISEIALPDDEIYSEGTQEKLLALVRGYPHIKTLTIKNPLLETEQAIQFRKELWQALAINREVGSDIRIAEASAAMKALLDKKSTADEELPFVPLDVTNELTRAIARHVPAEKANAIFDELILHAPKTQ